MYLIICISKQESEIWSKGVTQDILIPGVMDLKLSPCDGIFQDDGKTGSEQPHDVV